MGILILILLLITEAKFLIFRITTKSYQTRKRKVAGMAIFLLLFFMAITGIVTFSFRWYLLYLIFLMEALLGVRYLLRKKQKSEKIFQKRVAIGSAAGKGILISIAVIPAIVFPQFKPIEPSGDYEIETVSYTLTDQDRMETFTDGGENRKVTIQFWYPANGEKKYPLTVFSHGAFGFRGSNISTFEELARNGYVVCSIDHTYHSFFTRQTDGKIIICNTTFLNDAIAAQNDIYEEQKTYELSWEWLKLRADDVNFVLDDILKSCNNPDADSVYQLIDDSRIGLFGHSMGGATAAYIGRERSDIDAVIVIDGTMFGEEIGFENGKAVLNIEPYPVPLLNLYNESHFEEAKLLSDLYPNTLASRNAIDARDVVIRGSGHLNFTDLPMFSPILASALDTGKVDSRYCIETMNQIILKYFNFYLKDATELILKPEY